MLAETARFAAALKVSVTGRITEHVLLVNASVPRYPGEKVPAAGWYHEGIAYYFRPAILAGDLAYGTALAAHETCHQWSYGAIGNDQALEPWLDEALSTYCERIYYVNFYPEALDGWWWPYRINYDSPAGWVNTSIYNPQGDAHPYRAYRSAAYFNGARFLEELRTQVGDQAFFNFLHAYVAKFTGQIVQAQDFFDLLSKYTSVDLSPLLSQYFSGTALK